MRAIWVVALGLGASMAVAGCKGNKPEPIPGPKVGAAYHARAAGIAWFQGSVEEAFSKVTARPPTGQNQASSHPWDCPNGVKG